MRSLEILLGILLVLSPWPVAAKRDRPSIEITPFESIPVNLFYFEDSDVVMVTNPYAGTVYRSEDAGVTWKPLDGVEKGEGFEVYKHPYNNKVAVVVGNSKRHWITKDQGKSWTDFETKDNPTLARAPLSFHATDADRILFIAAECVGWDCQERVYYTTDGFDTKPKLLHDDAIMCLWAQSTQLFKTGDKDADLDQTLCIIKGDFSAFSSNYKLLISDDFFASKGIEPVMEDERTVSGLVNIAAVKSYIVAAAKSEGSSEMAMYVTDDTVTWHRAEFGEHTLDEDSYTLLESTNYSMQVDVMTTRRMFPMGVLFTSNSNGTFFTKTIEHTNRNFRGFVDFEKIQDIQGIMMVNVVDNWEEIEQLHDMEKNIKTKISFDDGRTWMDMSDKDGGTLHLHSVTEQRNAGRIFSSPAPGLVMGIGNTGKYLDSYLEGDLYVSDDAGLTWRKALSGPYLYEFGDAGAILVAVKDGETDEIRWSLDHGKTWEKLKLDDSIRPMQLTQTPDSTSLKFILTASNGKGSNTAHSILSIDFTDLHERECKKGDFEDWYARVDDDGTPTCIMGHTQMYRRRKADADCFVNDEFKEPLPHAEDCKCIEADYECDYNFMRSSDGKDCIPSRPLEAPEDACTGDSDTFHGRSGWRLIPGNTCTKRGGIILDEPIERPCGDTEHQPASGVITSEITEFKGQAFKEYYYLERAELASGEDETIIMRTDQQTWLTHDHGVHWRAAVEDGKEIVAIYPHQYNNDRVYMITGSKTVYYSENRGKKINAFEAPEAPNQDRLPILTFHPKEKDWLIWTGGKDCSKGDCHTVAHVSTKGGEDWSTLLRFVRKCQFVYREDRHCRDELVYCEQFQNEDPEGALQLLSSDDWFEHKEVHFENVINFATVAEFIVVAVRDDDQKSLRVDTSIDGSTFANAQFPANFHVPHQQAYTVLDSSTHAVFLHVTVNNRDEQEFGSIIKSNSNGTSYVLSINGVNRNGPGYVDFEKMQGLEGVAIVNVVANVDEASTGESKKLRTLITHNDGAEWGYISPPDFPPEGKKFECKDRELEKCALHLHGYTERRDPRNTFSSPSAVGLMMGVGNVGEHLGLKNEGDTFITTDGGVTWKSAAPGTWMWEYGDQGSIIVMVKNGEPVDNVLYTLDEGATWKSHQFGRDLVTVDDITTVPSDTSRNFLLWGKIKGKLVTVNLNFEGLTDKKCHLDEDKPNDGDFYLWSPRHPLSDDDCLFGHVAQYHRKRTDRLCYVAGRVRNHLHNIAKNCTCTRQDFECDYNYERQNDGSCALVTGLEPLDHKAVCQDDKVIEYYEPTGYRRIPLTTCGGGKEMDYTSTSHACPGKEPEYKEKHGISGVGLFFAIVVPIAAAAAIGWWVWQNWEAKFGSIRLGDGGFGGSALAGDTPWIKYPVAAISGLVAVLAAVPMVIMSVYRAVSSRFGRGSGGTSAYSTPYTSRSSFQRGRGDYAVVDPDEGELLGDDSDDEA